MKFDYDPTNEDDKKASMKYLFLRRFAKEGRTLEAAYSAWGSLTFDPNKDDIEQFILKVEELAKKLGYNEDAQVMAVKSVLPRDVYGICMTHKTLKELKTFLIDLFANPKMREAVPGTASVSGEPGVFSIGQHVENNVVNPTVADVSKIHQDMNALQVRFNKMSSADFRNKTSKPWKPEVTPPKRRGGFNRGRGGRQYENAHRNDRFKNENDGQNRDINQRDNTGNFRNRGQGRGRFKSNFRGKGRGRGGFDKSPNIRRPRVASKAVDKDKMRCHYCNEFGHFIRECSKKTRDEKKAGQFSGMSMDYYGDDLEMKRCDLTWSILSTEIDYTTNKDNCPYSEMNTSNLYNRLQEDEQLITESSSDQWDERFEEVTCSLHYLHKFDDTNDVSTTYLGSYLAKDKPRTFPVDNHIPFDGRGMSKAYLSNGTPMKMFFDSGASRSYLSKRFYDTNPTLHDMPKYVTTCTGIRIGNGSIVPALFVIPILFMACGHTLKYSPLLQK